MKSIQELREEAQDIGLFLPLIEETDVIGTSETVHGKQVPTRAVLLMQSAADADSSGAPTAQTVARYQDAVRQQQYGIVMLEPAAISAEARTAEGHLALTAETAAAFADLVQAVKTASAEAFGTQPLVFALLDHAGHHALVPCAMEHNETLPTDAPLLTDMDLTELVIRCGNAAQAAETAGFDGAALNAADRNLFGESLAAFHREGKFGGDFDDRTRFVRDCYTAMKMMTHDLLFSIRLSLSDGIAQPNGWGMAFEDESAPDLYEPALLLKILRTLYDVQIVVCSIGIPHISWMLAAEPEPELIAVSRLCTCIAMLDSDMQENLYLVMPQQMTDVIPFDALASGMIEGEFASFAGFLPQA
ncbi:MAG TPA: hypothetical protein DCG49_02760 [Ruminococcus sp.]|nr:hypothetical protein [Ruminococcus sp.]